MLALIRASLNVSIAAVLAVTVKTGGCTTKPVPQATGTATARATCGYRPGALASTTLDPGMPFGDQIPIDHIVLVMNENRSFDHYYSSLTVPGQTLDGASPTATNPDPTRPGEVISRFHQSAFCFDDPSHSWDNTHIEYDNGKLDGFTTANAEPGDPSGERAMGYYDESDLPFYYALARTFTISDRHFCSVLGPTWPNRLFFFAGTSFGETANFFPPTYQPNGQLYPNIFLELNNAKVSWKVYTEDLPTPAIFVNTWGNNIEKFTTIDQFLADAKAGQLPSVSVIEGADSWGGDSRDEHPPADMQAGQNLWATVISALMSSPNWRSSALFLTYDEEGGLYDHVVPPAACAPDSLIDPMDNESNVSFTQYGFRVPFLAVSPYVKRGYVSHVVTDHTSILRFVETRFNLPAMTIRDANATPPFDMFDFDHPDYSVPDLPDAAVDPTQLATCEAAYPRSTSSF
jgi:phospholipase C